MQEDFEVIPLGGIEGSNRVTWIKWETVCKLKELGGLGINDWDTFNKALLRKWRWRLLANDGSLWSRVVRSK